LFSLLSCHSARTASGQVTADRDPYSVSREASSLSSWILEAWGYCPVAHHVLLVELARHANAINRSTCDGDITTHGVACTLALIKHCTEDGSTECSHASLEIERNITTDLPAFTLWLYRIHPKADMEFFSSLSQLSLSVERSQNSSRTSNDDRAYYTITNSKRQISLVEPAYDIATNCGNKTQKPSSREFRCKSESGILQLFIVWLCPIYFALT
jgi:hypothetical protein